MPTEKTISASTSSEKVVTQNTQTVTTTISDIRPLSGDGTPLNWSPVPLGTHYTTIDEPITSPDSADYINSFIDNQQERIKFTVPTGTVLVRDVTFKISRQYTIFNASANMNIAYYINNVKIVDHVFPFVSSSDTSYRREDKTFDLIPDKVVADGDVHEFELTYGFTGVFASVKVRTVEVGMTYDVESTSLLPVTEKAVSSFSSSEKSIGASTSSDKSIGASTSTEKVIT